MNLANWFRNSSKTTWLKGMNYLFLALLVIILFSQKVDLSNIDLGRHLENGRLVFSQPQLLFTNFYSYTEPSFPFINHHWLAGLIFYSVYALAGFVGLSIFQIILALATFFIFFKVSKDRSNFLVASILSLPALLLLSTRIEIRPEILSYLFLGLYFLILENKSLSRLRKLLYLALIMLIWVNSHIYFIFGLVLVGAYYLADIIKAVSNTSPRERSLSKLWSLSSTWVYSFFALIAVALINPNHIKGLLYPLNIFTQYGFDVAENQTIFLLQKMMIKPEYLIYKFLLVLFIVALLANWFLRRKKTWSDWFFGTFIMVLSLLYSRNLALFALVAMIMIAPSLNHLILALKAKLKLDTHLTQIYFRLSQLLIISLMVGMLIFFLRDPSNKQLLVYNDVGWGLAPESLAMTNYYQQKNLKGPILNNYDVGSALIFFLSQEEPVFVDNRPEAYSISFFQDSYIPMQEEEIVWQEELAKYDFSTIIFTHTDSTPWSSGFLRKINQDSDWSLIYFDRYYIILVRKDKYDPSFIEEETLADNTIKEKIRALTKTGDLLDKFVLADLSSTLGQDYLAKEIYQAILYNNPNNFRARIGLANSYASEANLASFTQAIKNYKLSLDSYYVKIPGPLRAIGLIYWELAEYAKAEEYFKKAVKRGDDASRDYLQQIKNLRLEGKLP